MTDKEAGLRNIENEYYGNRMFGKYSLLSFIRERCKEYASVDPDPKWHSAWLAAGRGNPWISEAWDPPFTIDSFVDCYSPEELYVYAWHGNWSLGTAFTLGNLCFINQVDGGDEWLTIKWELPFESASLKAMIKAGTFFDFIERIQKASYRECYELEY